MRCPKILLAMACIGPADHPSQLSSPAHLIKHTTRAMASIFTRIINGEIPCFKVAESEHCIAFLDIGPVAKGHTLVVPKKEVDRLFDLDDDTYIELQLFAKRVSTAIEQVVPCNRIGVTVIGLEVPHAHIHLIPSTRFTT